MKLVWYDEYLVNTVDTDGLVLSTRSSVAIVLSMYLCFFNCIWVQTGMPLIMILNIFHQETTYQYHLRPRVSFTQP